MKVGDLVQNIRKLHSIDGNREAGEEMGIVMAIGSLGGSFKILLLGEAEPHRNWRIVKNYEVIG